MGVAAKVGWCLEATAAGGSTQAAREAEEGEVEVRGWLKATGMLHGVQECKAHGKRLEHDSNSGKGGMSKEKSKALLSLSNAET